MSKNKKSFFEKLTGSLSLPTEEEELDELIDNPNLKEEGVVLEEKEEKETPEKQEWPEEEGGQLIVDMYQTPSEIVIKTMVAGVEPNDLDVSISQDMITLKGHRQKSREVDEENYFYKELYWGGFSRSILLPQEVDSDGIKASFKNGLLTIRLPKTKKEKSQKIDIKID